MVHVPLRGLFVLTRAAVAVVAVAAVPVVLRKCKPLAKKIGDTLVKAGEQLRESAENADSPKAAAEQTRAATSEPPAEGASKQAPKKPAAKKRTVKKKSPPKKAGA